MLFDHGRQANFKRIKLPLCQELTIPSNLNLSVILPCYNEALAVKGVIADWETNAPLLKQKLAINSIELLIVDDGSSDGGCDFLELESLNRNLPLDLKVIRHTKNQGYGQSLKTGLLKAQGDWIVFHDCDGTCKARDLENLWKLKDQSDLVVGLRLTSTTKMPLLRKTGNLLYQSLFRLFFGQRPHDLCSGYRLFRKAWVQKFTTELPNQLNFTLAMSLWMSLNGKKIVEAPITYEDRLGESKLSAWVDGWRFLFTILRYRFIGMNKDN